VQGDIQLTGIHQLRLIRYPGRADLSGTPLSLAAGGKVKGTLLRPAGSLALLVISHDWVIIVA
jgi:hypothetical protein